MPNREGGSAFRRGATKHQIKKVRVVSKMTKNFVCFCFLSSSRKNSKREGEGGDLGERELLH